MLLFFLWIRPRALTLLAYVRHAPTGLQNLYLMMSKRSHGDASVQACIAGLYYLQHTCADTMF